MSIDFNVRKRKNKSVRQRMLAENKMGKLRERLIVCSGGSVAAAGTAAAAQPAHYNDSILNVRRYTFIYIHIHRLLQIVFRRIETK